MVATDSSWFVEDCCPPPPAVAAGLAEETGCTGAAGCTLGVAAEADAGAPVPLLCALPAMPHNPIATSSTKPRKLIELIIAALRQSMLPPEFHDPSYQTMSMPRSTPGGLLSPSYQTVSMPVGFFASFAPPSRPLRLRAFLLRLRAFLCRR